MGGNVQVKLTFTLSLDDGRKCDESEVGSTLLDELDAGLSSIEVEDENGDVSIYTIENVEFS